jgi:hypothetical protein
VRVGDDCRVYLLRRRRGEVYGQTLFGRLADSSTDGVRRDKWRILEQLERQTKNRIEALLDRAGIPVGDATEAVREGEADARRLGAVDWQVLMRGFRRELEAFVVEFREAEKLDRSAGELGDLLRYITAHEEALLRFAVRELEGGEHDSLDAVQRLLDVPGSFG